MAIQNIKNLKVADLCLWTENPRDPIDTTATDFDIIKHAIDENPKAWNLDKLVVEMGAHYDLSELPTVVYIDKKPVVYDGNRRIAVLKYLQNPQLYTEISGRLPLGYEPQELKALVEIPCNVCDQETALANIERKHSTNGSWGQLERDYFAYKHRGKDKSLFVRLNEQTGGYIANHKSMNKLFVKDEVLNAKNLREIGFLVSDTGEIETPYSVEESLRLLENIRSLIESKEISTRNNRGLLKQPLEEFFSDTPLKSTADSTALEPLSIEPLEDEPVNSTGTPKQRKTPRTKKKSPTFFFDNMPSLTNGEVNDIYRDILSLHDYYIQEKDTLSATFPALIRMSLRLLVESASGSDGINAYINNNYTDAKKNLTQDQKTTLSNNSVDSEQRLVQLLQSGAHNYTNSANFEQTTAMSIIIGAIVSKTHQKNKNDTGKDT